MSYWIGKKHKVGGFASSLTRWEDSYYGGYTKVLMDYPSIDVPYDLDYKPDNAKMKDLYAFTHGKLMRIFLYNVKEEHLVEQLIEDITVRVVDTGWKKYNRYEVAPESIEYCVNKLIDRKGELANLFREYQEVIQASHIFYDEPVKKDEGEAGMKEGDADGGPMEKKKKGKAALRKMMGEIGKWQPGKYHGSMGSVSGDLKTKATFRMIERKAVTETEKGFYTTAIMQASDHLVRLLDISFDPAPDRINNLRMGKLDPRKICEIPCGNFHVYYREEANVSTKPFSVCVLGDESGSMGPYGAQRQRDLFKMLYRGFSQIIPQEKMFFYGHSGGSTPDIRVYHDPYNPYFEETIWHMGKNMGENYDGPVIEAIYDKVRSMTDDNILFLSLSDGAPSGSGYGGEPAIKQLQQVIEKCKRDGFVTMGIGLQFGAIKKIYHYHTIVTELDLKLVEQTTTLINRVVKSEFQSS